MAKAYFITIEGVEGAGKSSVSHFLQDYLEAKAIDFIMTREPGGTPIAEAIRQVLLTVHDEPMQPMTELLLMFAGRAQNVEQVIKPALKQGQWVISDRFTDASIAYQGGGRQLPRDRIDQLAEWVQADLKPDLTLLLDVPVEIGLGRIQSRGGKDRIEREGRDFFERIRKQYLDLAASEPKRFCVIDGTQALLQVVQQVEQALRPMLEATQ
ncbi:MAG: dTMP kinase [Gammaproteobacteria bacterium]|nr:dTMP kinase [Gammaproteobacteria bacterium]